MFCCAIWSNVAIVHVYLPWKPFFGVCQFTLKMVHFYNFQLENCFLDYTAPSKSIFHLLSFSDLHLQGLKVHSRVMTYYYIASTIYKYIHMSQGSQALPPQHHFHIFHWVYSICNPSIYLRMALRLAMDGRFACVHLIISVFTFPIKSSSIIQLVMAGFTSADLSARWYKSWNFLVAKK